MDFKQTVMQLLTEDSGDSKPVQEWLFKLDNGNIVGLSKEMKESNIKNAYQTAYGNFPSDEAIKGIFNTWQKCWTRTSAAQMIAYASYTPIITFIADLASKATPADNVEARFRSVPISKALFDSMANNFIKALKNAPTKNPIDFKPINTAEATYIIQQVLKGNQNQLIAAASLENYMSNNIKETIYKILEARKKVRLATLSDKSVPDQGKAVLDVLLHPENYAGGRYAFSDKVSSDKIYTRAVHTQLLELGLQIKAFFQSEAGRLSRGVENKEAISDTKNQNKISVSDMEHNLFLNNASLDSNRFYAFHSESTRDEVIAEDVGQGGYIIKNIKKLSMSSENVQAKEMYEKLLEFANYVKEGEITDWIKVAQGAKQIAKGLSLGTPNLGGKR